MTDSRWEQEGWRSMKQVWAEIDRLRAELEQARVNLKAHFDERVSLAVENEALREAGEGLALHIDTLLDHAPSANALPHEPEVDAALARWREVVDEKPDPDEQLMEMEC